MRRLLHFESVAAIHTAVGGATDVGDEALVALVECALRRHMIAPGLTACSAAPVVAVEQLANDIGEQLAVDVFSFSVHGTGALIVGSKFHSMKELRPAGTSIRILFIFDPRRQAILLLGGDKADNWKSWWPIYRRMHLGTSLEGLAVEEARSYGSSEIRLLMNEADCIIGPPRAAGREFAQACGYDLRWRATVGPRARMTGIKSV